MKALVVYDTRSGYTEAIAEAVAEALRGPLEVTLLRVDAPGAYDTTDADLLVVGGPTEGHGATEAMRAWLHGLGTKTLRDLPAAAFDTRLHWPKLLSGSAADEIARSLHEAGCRLLAEPESFFVGGRENAAPTDAELEHARGWANEVYDRLPATVG